MTATSPSTSDTNCADGGPKDDNVFKDNNDDLASKDHSDLDASLGLSDNDCDMKMLPTEPNLPAQKPFPWDKLPGEVKNIIYDFALTFPHPIWLKNAWDVCSDISRRLSVPRCRTRITPNLLLCNKQTYKEGLPILYGNDFWFVDGSTIYRFFTNLSSRSVKYVKRITICLDSIGPLGFQHMIGLEFESLRFHHSSTTGVEGKAWAIFSTAYWYLKSIDTAKAAAITNLTGQTVESTSPARREASAEETEKAVLARVMELLDDESYDVHAGVHKGGAFDYPAFSPVYPKSYSHLSRLPGLKDPLRLPLEGLSEEWMSDVDEIEWEECE